MTADALLSHIAGHAGISPARASHVARTVLSALGARLTPARRELVADELPDALAAALRDDASAALPVEERLLEPGITIGRARELVASVCRVLAEELSTQALDVLRDASPRELAELLARPGADLASRPAEPRSTLAAGRPGSRRPISETAPPAAQTGSVAEPNPHGGAKLSSSPGTMQERRRTTLADARPDDARTLADPERTDRR